MARNGKAAQRRRIRDGLDPKAAWTVSTSYISASGRHVEPGTELSFHGERGRFRFVEHVTTDTGAEWLSVIGGTSGVRMWRAFTPDRIKRVHYKQKTMTTEEARRLVNEKNATKRKATQ